MVSDSMLPKRRTCFRFVEKAASSTASHNANDIRGRTAPRYKTYLSAYSSMAPSASQPLTVYLPHQTPRQGMEMLTSQTLRVISTNPHRSISCQSMSPDGTQTRKRTYLGFEETVLAEPLRVPFIPIHVLKCGAYRFDATYVSYRTHHVNCTTRRRIRHPSLSD